MKHFARFALAALLLALAPVLDLAPANAAAALIGGDTSFPNNSKIIGFGDVTLTTTSSATYGDLAGSSVTYTPTVYDCTTAARATACLIEVDWSLEGSKATVGVGVCTPYVNGATVTNAERTIQFVTSASYRDIGGVFLIPNTTVGAQTLKIQCKSPDTNALTINVGHVVYREIILPARH